MATYCEYIPYNKTYVDTRVPENAGAYKISKEKDYDASKVFVIYVGKTDNLRRQLTKHLSSKEDNVSLRGKIRDGNLWVSWAEIPIEDDRITEEIYLIDRYRPGCIVQHTGTVQNK